MIIVATFLTRSVVTRFTIKSMADFWQVFIAVHCYILATENLPKPFPKNTFYFIVTLFWIKFFVFTAFQSDRRNFHPFSRKYLASLIFGHLFLSIFDFCKHFWTLKNSDFLPLLRNQIFISSVTDSNV